MAKRVGQVTRKKGYMYFVMGNGDVMETKMKHGKGKKKKSKK